MLEFSAVSKTYNKDVKALSNLSLTVYDGDIFAFLGQNGAGKTTAIKLITGQCSPQDGAMYIDSIDIEENPVEAKRRFSIVSEDLYINEKLTGLEHLRFFGQVYGLEKTVFDERVSHYAQLFSIKEMLSAVIQSYSSGMKQKLRIISSLLSDPHNWILDEPLNGLDPDAVFVLKEIMRERSVAGKTVFFSSHIMEVAEKLCTRLAILGKGTLLFCGTFAELRDAYAQCENAQKDADLETIFFSFTGLKNR